MKKVCSYLLNILWIYGGNMKVAFCYLCCNRFSVEDKATQFVKPQVFKDMCVATKNNILCADRNKNGKCKYYKELEETYTGG
jgi:hypothetical protein